MLISVIDFLVWDLNNPFVQKKKKQILTFAAFGKKDNVSIEV